MELTNGLLMPANKKNVEITRYVRAEMITLLVQEVSHAFSVSTLLFLSFILLISNSKS